MNVYESCPTFKSKNFTLRPLSHDDTEDLLKVYSDEKAVPFFNSDNCHGDDFHYTTTERMKQAMDFWDFSYKNKYFVRWTVADKNNTAVGTVELFNRSPEKGDHSEGVLRLDLRSDHERAEIIAEILETVIAHAYGLFDCGIIITKAIPAAAVRIKALEGAGFVPAEALSLSDYFQRKR